MNSREPLTRRQSVIAILIVAGLAAAPVSFVVRYWMRVGECERYEVRVKGTLAPLLTRYPDVVVFRSGVPSLHVAGTVPTEADIRVFADLLAGEVGTAEAERRVETLRVRAATTAP